MATLEVLMRARTVGLNHDKALAELRETEAYRAKVRKSLGEH